MLGSRQLVTVNYAAMNPVVILPSEASGGPLTFRFETEKFGSLIVDAGLMPVGVFLRLEAPLALWTVEAAGRFHMPARAGRKVVTMAPLEYGKLIEPALCGLLTKRVQKHPV